ncbi:MAG: hypothetical protein HY314_15640 [Acidobacteria bacterium]|nr:hypothetical protein [Acidobacteriota bacterium]
MLNLTEEQKQNEELARQINREARANPNSPYAGKHVGIVRGQVVAVGDTLDELMDLLEPIEPEPEHRHVVEASADYDTPDYIWRTY